MPPSLMRAPMKGKCLSFSSFASLNSVAFVTLCPDAVARLIPFSGACPRFSVWPGKLWLRYGYDQMKGTNVVDFLKFRRKVPEPFTITALLQCTGVGRKGETSLRQECCRCQCQGCRISAEPRSRTKQVRSRCNDLMVLGLLLFLCSIT